jgi:hypothetical protein
MPDAGKVYEAEPTTTRVALRCDQVFPRRGRPPRRDLSRLDDCSAELNLIYHKARRGRLDVADASRLCYILKIAHELAGEREVIAKLDAIEQRLEDLGTAPTPALDAPDLAVGTDSDTDPTP